MHKQAHRISTWRDSYCLTLFAIVHDYVLDNFLFTVSVNCLKYIISVLYIEKSIGSENGAEPDKSAIIPTYVIEIAKSGRAECRKCENKIGKNELRIGVITEGDWGKVVIVRISQS